MKTLFHSGAPASAVKQTFSLHAILLSAAVLCIALGMPSLSRAAGYYASGGDIYDGNGQILQIRGINHYGFNSLILQPQYLWEMGWKQQIAQIKSLGFNAVRVPFVPDTLYSTKTVDQLSYVNPALNPDLIGKTPLQVLDLWMAEADAQGLYLLLDFHSVSMQRQYPTWFVTNSADFNLIYNNQAYTPADWARDLSVVAKRYAHLTHFFAIDIYNEPNGKVRWDVGDPHMTDASFNWKPAAEAAASAILKANPNLLIFVQGITANYDGIEKTNIAMNWGENFQAEAYQPLNIPNDKLVLTPHTYGPDVYEKASFSDSAFPANLNKDWDVLFGQFFKTHPVIIGEWGGHYGIGGVGERDIKWQNALVDYLLSKGVRNSFYWCYTPNSFDTGGILDDNLKVREDKMAMLKKLWGDAPAPTTIAVQTSTPVAAAAVTLSSTTPVAAATVTLSSTISAPAAATSSTSISQPTSVAATTAAPVTTTLVSPISATSVAASAASSMNNAQSNNSQSNNSQGNNSNSGGGGPIDAALLTLLGGILVWRWRKAVGAQVRVNFKI